MLGWGISLMVVGALSFALPLMGRQFLLVSLVGLTGIGSVVAGLVLFIVGVMLFFAGGGGRFFGSSELTVVDPRDKKPDRISTSGQPIVAKAASPTHLPTGGNRPAGEGSFRIGTNAPLQPVAFAATATNLALEGSEEAMNELVSTNAGTSEEFRSKIGAARFHFLALHAAVYYVCAERVCSSDVRVMEKVGNGLATSFAFVFDKDGDTANGMAEQMYGLFQTYAASLLQELLVGPGDNPFSLGATAELLASNVAVQCDINLAAAEKAVDKLRVEMVCANHGIKLLMTYLATKHIVFAG
jgi:hypothetical protein